MRLATILAIGCAAVLAPPVVMATQYTDYDSLYDVNTGGGKLVDATHSVSGIFDFRTGGDPTDLDTAFDTLGYNPLTQTVTGVSLSIQLLDGAVPQQAVISLDGSSFLTLPFIGSTTFGGTLDSTQTAALIAAAQDGRVNFTISASGNSSFFATFAELSIFADRKDTGGGSGVPDGGSSLALLGFAIVGLGLAKRKLS